ncbi:MAG TPA: efflux RND transporter permease subunit, partial [Spirochaetota bacterium]|nr:efflux RND transporter permease subunit [Spirochaetota bacterium]
IRVNGNKSLLLSLEMHYGNNIVNFGKDVDRVLAGFSNSMPSDVKVGKIADMPRVVDKSITEFLIEFFVAIVAVILVTMVLLPKRIAGIAAVTIPLSILITLGILHLMNVELHTVSLAALIVVLGMVVDNSIVIIDNHVEKLDQGLNPWDAARKSASELFVPVLTATLSIIAAFLPLVFFMTGLAKDMFKTFSITVAVTLLVSLIVAVFIVPMMNYTLIRKGLKHDSAENRRSFLDRMQTVYDGTLKQAFNTPKTTIAIGIISVIAGLLLAVSISRELFPKVTRNQFAIEVYMPVGGSIDETEKAVLRIEDLLKKDKRVVTVASFVGTGSPRFHTVYAPNMPSKNYAQFIVNTISNEATEEILREYDKKYGNFIPGAYVKWKQLEISLSSSPIEVRISGDNVEDLKKVGASISGIMNKVDGFRWVHDDYEQPLQGVLVDVRKDDLNRLGLTKTFLAYSLAAGFKGLPLSTVWEGDHRVDIVLRTDRKGKPKYQNILNQYVSAPMAFTNIPLRQVAEIRPEWTEGQIVRRNGVRTLTVKGEVHIGRNASDILEKIVPEIEKLDLPAGVNLEYGGDYEGERENYPRLAYSLLTGVIVMFVILLFQFKKMKLSLLILTTMPLCVLGAVTGLLVAGYPFGFTSFLGLISLSGIVVRNGIILVDYGESLISRHNMTVREAALLAGKRRMRPIFLTSAAAAVGVVPMMMSRSPLWGPLGAVICFGMLFSMVLTLYVLPVLYMYIHKSDDVLQPE